MSAAVAVPERVQPRAMPGALLGVAGGLTVLGIVAFFAGLASDPEAAWRAFHVNYLYFGALGQAGIVLSCTFVIVGARWPGPVRRFAESMGAWVPLTVVLFLVAWIGREHVYIQWMGESGPPAGKEAWLNPGRLFWTDLSIFAVLAGLSLAFLYNSIRPTLGGAAERSGPAAGLLNRWSAGWRGDAEEREICEGRCRVLAPIICLAYAFGWSIVCFDQVMSLTPTWFSNLFGAYFAWGAFLSAIALTALLSVLHRNSPGLEGEITKARMHDLGKMIFAFSIFWMYLFFSQYIVIWYGNLPEETGFMQQRLGSQFMVDKSGIGDLFLNQTWELKYFWARLQEPYAMLSLAVWACCWIIPFWVLLGQRPKKTPLILGPVSMIVLIGFWLERNVLVWPSLVPDATMAFAGWIQLGVAAGFTGAFALVILLFTRVFPALPVPDRS